MPFGRSGQGSAGARLPDELIRSSVYVYFASWTYLGDPAVVRFHWGRIAINR